MLFPFFIFKLIHFLTFVRIVVTGVLRTVMIAALLAIEWGLMLFLFLASMAPDPSRIAHLRRTVATIDPFQPLKQDNGVLGLIARLFD